MKRHLKVLKTEKRRLEFEAIPEIMDEMGIERVDVDDATVSLKAFVSASIPVDRRQEAAKKSGHGCARWRQHCCTRTGRYHES